MLLVIMSISMAAFADANCMVFCGIDKAGAVMGWTRSGEVIRQTAQEIKQFCQKECGAMSGAKEIPHPDDFTSEEKAMIQSMVVDIVMRKAGATPEYGKIPEMQEIIVDKAYQEAAEFVRQRRKMGVK